MNAAFSALTGWLLFGGLALATGAVSTRWLILPRALSAEDLSSDPTGRATAQVGLIGALLATVGVLFYFGRQLQEFRDPFVPWTEDADLLLNGTAWGTAWIRAAVGSTVAVTALAIARSGRAWGWWIATPVVLALCAFPGLTGHAAATENFRILALLADTTHVWAAGAWIGGLATVLYLERGARTQDSGQSLLPVLVPAFSTVAMVSVATLLLTGTFATWAHLPGLSALVSTGYGRSLAIKLALVGLVLGMGAKNFRVLTPRLGTAEGDDAMRRSATIELIIAQLVLIATAVLVRTSPMDP